MSGNIDGQHQIGSAARRLTRGKTSFVGVGFARRLVVGVVAAGIALSACGGSETQSNPTIPTTIPIPTTTLPPVTTPPANQPVSYVTAGAKVVVANASRVNGAAARMTEQLKKKGYDVGTPVGSGAAFQRIDVTKIFYVDGNADAKAVADGLKVAFARPAIEVLPMPSPAPTESGELEAGVSVVAVIGNDVADKTLDQLQGVTTPPTAAPGATATTAAGGGASPATTAAGAVTTTIAGGTPSTSAAGG